MIKRIQQVTGYEPHGVNRVRRTTTLALVAFVILLVGGVVTGTMIHNEIVLTYSENYQVLSDAGFDNIITAPEVVSDRLTVLLSLIPLMGIGIVLPLLLRAACELNNLSEELANCAKNKS